MKSKILSLLLLLGIHHNCLQANDRVIFGEDNRKDIFEVNNPKYVEWAKSTGVIGTKPQLVPIDNNNFSLITAKYKDSYNLCPHERFANQLQGGHCSGFLISEDLFATAGHCVMDIATCNNMMVMFDYAIHSREEVGLSKVAKQNVFFCKEIIATLKDNYNDFAIIKLDRPTGRKPLNLRTSGKVANGEDLVLIGNPFGLPTKIADGANVLENTNSSNFRANTDGFGGNSGSAVINIHSGEVEGILTHGWIDFVNTAQGCNVANVLPDKEGNESIYRSILFSRFLLDATLGPIKNIIKSANNINLPIPNNDLSGTTYEFNVDDDYVVLNAKLHIDIIHKSSSEIGIIVLAPDGSSHTVKSPVPDFTKDFHSILGMPKTMGKKSKGIWKVKINDIAEGDSGYVSSLKLELNAK